VNNVIKPRRLRCSFCRKDETQVSKLVAGPRVYICDECVAAASRIMDGGPTDDDQPLDAEPTAWRRMVCRARRLWRGGDARRVRAAHAPGI
jgi:ClpX C4-type zinc finger